MSSAHLRPLLACMLFISVAACDAPFASEPGFRDHSTHTSMVVRAPTGGEATAIEMNDSGQVVGTYQNGSRVFLWSSIRSLDLTDQFSISADTVIGINDRGEILVREGETGYEEEPLSAVFRPHGPPEVIRGNAVDINDEGAVLFSNWVEKYIWTDGQKEAVVLPDGYRATLLRLNNQGEIFADFEWNECWFGRGIGRAAGILRDGEATIGPCHHIGRDFNDDGLMIVMDYYAGRNYFRRDGYEIPVRDFEPVAVNNHGVSAGKSLGKWVIREDDSLREIVIDDARWEVSSVIDINDNGQVLVLARGSNPPDLMPLVLTPR